MVEFAFHYLKSYEVMKNKYENNILMRVMLKLRYGVARFP
jgi:hypothetical protein